MALITTAGSASANSYGDADGALAYFLATGRDSQWEQAVAGKPEAWLLRAMPCIEANSFPGSRATSAQALQFPRIGGTNRQAWPSVVAASAADGLYDLRGRFFESDSIPEPLKNAQYEQAFAMATDDQWLDDRYESREIKTGSATLKKRTGRSLGKLCHAAVLQLDGLLLAGRGVVNLVRS